MRILDHIRAIAPGGMTLAQLVSRTKQDPELIEKQLKALTKANLIERYVEEGRDCWREIGRPAKKTDGLKFGGAA